MAGKTSEITRLEIEKGDAETRLFAVKEAQTQRRWATTSFAAVVAAFSLLLALTGYFGFPKLIEATVGDFLKEKGATESLQKLGSTMALAEEKKDSIVFELTRAQKASTQIQTMAAVMPQLIGFLETNVTGLYPSQPAGWRWVPYQDGKPLQFPIKVSSLSDVYLVTFSYRVSGSTDGLKFSRINIVSKGEKPVKTVEAVGATLKSTEFGASGSLVVASLQKGDYTVVVEDFDSQGAYRKYESLRQLCVYKLR